MSDSGSIEHDVQAQTAMTVRAISTMVSVIRGSEKPDAFTLEDVERELDNLAEWLEREGK